MFKKTKVREILELMQRDLSEREISGILGVSRNSVARIREGSILSGKNWDELLSMNDEDLYHLFYPGKFKRERNYAKEDYAYKIPSSDNNLRKLYDSKKAKMVIDSL